MTPRQIALEHIAYCYLQSQTPEQVCQSVEVYLRDQTWTDALHAIMRRQMEMRAGVEIEPVNERRRVA